MIEQLAIAVTGVVAIWLSQDARPTVQRWARGVKTHWLKRA